MKTTDKREVKTPACGVWCDSCSIRIAPNEEQIAAGDKIYHQRCYSKIRSSPALNGRGGER